MMFFNLLFSDIYFICCAEFYRTYEEGARSKVMGTILYRPILIEVKPGKTMVKLYPYFLCKEMHNCVRRRHLSGRGVLKVNKDILVFIHSKRLYSFILM